MAKEGASVWICARTDNELEKTAEQIRSAGGRVDSRQVDLGDGNSLNAFITEVMEKSQSVDVLINNAGVLKLTPMAELTPEEYEEKLLPMFR